MKSILIFISMMLLNNSVLKSQSDFIIKTGVLEIPLSLINNSFYSSIAFEKALKKNFSLNFRLGYGLAETKRQNDFLRMESFNTTLFFKKYLSKSYLLRKWYFGLYLKNDFRTKQISLINPNLLIESNLNLYKYNYSGVGPLFGYQVLTKNGFCLDANMGLGVAYLSKFSQKTNSLPAENPNKVIGDYLLMFNLGYNFSVLFNKKTETKDKQNMTY